MATLSSNDILRGRIIEATQIKGRLNNTSSLKGRMVITPDCGHEYFDGEYNVTPTIDAQVIPTREKVMSDDITVHSIPFFEVANNKGGNTVIIGGDVKWQ